MHIEQQYFFWKLAYDLVSRHDFEIIHLHTQHNEVWLEKSQGTTSQVVRLLKKDFHWSNHVKVDLEHVNNQLVKNKRYFSGRKKDIHVVYVSDYPPVDDLADVSLKLEHNTHVHFLSDEEKESGLQDLSKKLNLTENLHIKFRIPDAPLEYESTIEYMKQQLHTYKEKQRQRVKAVFEFGNARLTYVLLMVNVIVFYYLETVGSTTSITTLIEYGAKYNPAIMDGEWWRLATSMFLHIGVLHIAMNMLALFYLGTAVEQIYGTWRFTIIYFLAGILGSAASFYFNDSVAAGASGAIFGLFGALLYFAWRYPSLFFRTMGWNLILLVAFNIAFGIMVPQVDNSGHMGGLIGGFIASQLVDLPRLSHRPLQTGAAMVYAGLLSLLVVSGMQKDEQVSAADIQYLNDLNVAQEYERVIDTANSLGEPDGEWEDEWLFQRSFAYIRTGEEEKAFDDLVRAIEIDPDFAEAHYNLSLLYERRGNEEKADYHKRQAEQLKPGIEDQELDAPS
ncbi:rhomboid family protein [Salimicrobium halophilum]|uniref:Rhomboid family peptidase. Serine peptidase. MEROPS family S54 n=1 Tax=Salimicrobium halophilum TaxID=86666 RepID=A0A1G8PSY8_9BACI|nr:rhomboid family intramembrane serine protease [Salimicrobium halophilum]SDI95386.1 rhomboid family peptidase. Serine peptidase. MEROPS family S54 [Salimicrobium halophilum]